MDMLDLQTQIADFVSHHTLIDLLLYQHLVLRFLFFKMLLISTVAPHLSLPEMSCLIFALQPFSAIKPECVVDPDCASHLACIREKCVNPCQSQTCGTNAECTVSNHRPLCVCIRGYEGDPYTICRERKKRPIPVHNSNKQSHIVHL